MSVVWVHEDAMSLDHPVFKAASPDAQPIFIWDTQEHDRRDYSLKRRVFIFETAHDLEIPIYTGDPVDVLAALSDGKTLYSAVSPDPYIQGVLAELRDAQKVVTIDTPRLAHIPANTDTGRFFRFWNRAKKSALTPSCEAPIDTMTTS